MRKLAHGAQYGAGHVRESSLISSTKAGAWVLKPDGLGVILCSSLAVQLWASDL